MTGGLFISYRRDDVPGDARGIRDALARKFGQSAVFMDVDNLLVGQRFDQQLASALAQCDVLIAVIGPRWMDLLAARAAQNDRDYVCDEIEAALSRGITVIPVRIGSAGKLNPLPAPDQLPKAIRDLVLHQKFDIAHEHFGRDTAELIKAIVATRRKSFGAMRSSWVVMGVGLALIAGAIWFTKLAAELSGALTGPIRDPVDAATAAHPNSAAEPDFIGIKLPPYFSPSDKKVDFGEFPDAKAHLDAMLKAYLSADVTTLSEFVHPTKGLTISGNAPDDTDPKVTLDELRADKSIFFPNYAGEPETRAPVSKALGPAHEHCTSFNGPTLNQLTRISYTEKFFREKYPDSVLVTFDCPEEPDNNNWNSVVFVLEKNKFESSDRWYLTDVAMQTWTP